MTRVLSIQNASLCFQQKFVFDKLNLDLHEGEWVALLGPSGIGKTSLLRMIAGIKTRASLEACEISYTTGSAENVAYMAQQDLLLPWLNVLQNTLLKTKLKSYSRTMYRVEKEKAKSLLAKVNLVDTIDLFPHQLSGGMRQRVALVRTLMEDKPIILMDEPFAALDAITRYKLQDLAANLLKNKTVLFITHDPTESLRLAHTIYIMQGKPANLRLAATMKTATPRKLTDANVTAMQAKLFHELMMVGDS